MASCDRAVLEKSVAMRFLQRLRRWPTRNSLAPFRRRARIRRFVRHLRVVVWMLIILVVLAVTALRLTTCAKIPISVYSPLAPIKVSSQLSPNTLYAKPTADVVEGDQ
jgi:hypothetical protein